MLDTSDELKIYRYGNGIKLIKPDFTNTNKRLFHFGYDTGHTVRSVLKLPCNVYFLNAESETQTMNEANAITIWRTTSVESTISKTIFDIAEYRSALSVRANDKEVFVTEKIKIIEEATVRKEDEANISTLTIKTPWYSDENKPVGVFGCSIVINHQSLAQSLAQIAQLNLLTPTKESSKNNLSLPGAQIDKVYLSRRETEILQYIVRGKTAKQIAEHLAISPRTIEQHIANIKSKMEVANKSELIEKAIHYLNHFVF